MVTKEIKELKELNNQKIKELDKKASVFSKIRIILVCLFIVFIFCILSLQEPVYYLFILTIVFIYIVVGIIYRPTFKKIEDIKLTQIVLDEYEYRENGKWKQFSDNGSKYLKTNLEHDLDIFGSGSLYQFINSTKTPSGREKLVHTLKNGSDDILQSQKEVSKLSDFKTSIKFNKALKKYYKKARYFNEEDLQTLKNIANTEVNINEKCKIGIIILSIISVISIILSIINLTFVSLVVITFIIQFFFTKINTKENEIFEYNTTNINFGINGYKILISELSNIDNIDISMVDFKPIKKLKNVCNAISSRKNIVAYIIGNIFFMDIITLLKMKSFSKNELNSFFNTINKIADYEVYLSLANINLIHANTSYPRESNKLEVKNIRHPLIGMNPIGNDFSLSGVIILTGSNMSGKTTFMRSIGINYILYQAGGAVLAEEFMAPKLKVYTSLRVNDMTTEGISTFYAELNRIKDMIDAIKNNEKILVLIDEIFKGTNALDRLIGSKRVIDKLNNQYAIISTHDFELCKLENIKNYHFEEEYNEGKIYFSYKIKEGQCKTTNGKFLMDSIGLNE